MPRKIDASQMSLVVLLMVSSLMLCLPLRAMEGWGYLYVSDPLGSTLKLKVPAGLTSNIDSSSGLLSLGTSAEVINTFNADAIPAGEWGIAIGALPIDVVQALAPAQQAMTPQLVVDTIINQMENSVDSLTFTASEIVTIAEHPAARVQGTSVQGDAVVIVVDIGNAYLLTTIVTAAGEQPFVEPLILSIIESAEYRP